MKENSIKIIHTEQQSLLFISNYNSHQIVLGRQIVLLFSLYTKDNKNYHPKHALIAQW